MIKGQGMHKVTATFFRLESFLLKKWYGLAHARPSSSPYLSGDTFRLIADYRYEIENKNLFQPSAIHSGDIVFCESWELHAFFDGPARDIRESFVLLSGNGDINITSELVSAMPESVALWFAQNVGVVDTRVRSLPIGLENAVKHWHGIIGDFEKLRRSDVLCQKRPRILFGFTIGTNEKERLPAFQSLARVSCSDSLNRVNSREYRKILQNYMFVASPPGNGIDCHRTWEALYLGVIPIVKRSVCVDEFSKLFPLWVVDDWSEIEEYDEQKLSKLYDELWNSKWKQEALWLPYWQKEIRAAAGRL